MFVCIVLKKFSRDISVFLTTVNKMDVMPSGLTYMWCFLVQKIKGKRGHYYEMPKLWGGI